MTDGCLSQPSVITHQLSAMSFMPQAISRLPVFSFQLLLIYSIVTFVVMFQRSLGSFFSGWITTT
jgi:hypothetical protein